MAKNFLENDLAEREANDIAVKFANSSDVTSDMGRAYNFDFSNVNMHEGGTDGIATTAGNNIYFGEGILSSNTPEANMVKGHELTHVMQQSGTPGLQSVEYGMEQNFSFSGMFRTIGNFFKNLFIRKRPAQPQAGQEAGAQQGAHPEEQPIESPLTEEQVQEKEQLFQQLRDIDAPPNQYVQNMPLEQLRAFVARRVASYKSEHGGIMEDYEESDRENGNKADVSEADLQELRKKDFFNDDMSSVAKMQREKGVQNTVNKETTTTFTRFSKGLYYANLLVRSTPYGKALVNKLENAGQEKNTWTRMYRSFRPVFLDKAGNFVSGEDRTNHEWNMQFVRDVAGNEGTTSIADLMDEIVQYGYLVDTIVDTPEMAKDLITYRFDAFGRLDQLGLTVDKLAQTEAFKKYLRAENGGVDPQSKDEWPPKAKYADRITTMVGMVANYITTIERKNGLYFNDFETEFIMPGKESQMGIGEDFTLENLRQVVNAERDEYNAARNAFREKK